jgi:glycine cleavage system H lipoate-binding protein
MPQSLNLGATTAGHHGWSLPVGPCVWMSAGLLAYRLCDHDYDCEHCPLDAALRGGRMPSLPAAGIPVRGATFPDDRRYTPGHLWFAAIPRDEVPASEGGGPHARAAPPAAAGEAEAEPRRRLRCGLDGFAAALAGAPLAVRSDGVSSPLPEGTVLCRLELGGATLPVAAPCAARRVWSNRRLESEPSLAAVDAYGEGWLFELEPCDEPPVGFDGPAAALRSRLDLRHFRHRVAADLLADGAGLGATLPDGGELLTDLRGILGLRRYVELLRELIH